ncbi:hypothetical protein BDF19DRAFT_443216 [Syncephalis fuscata]|nr:hypothetical protein BDF19DRAFT_443216 [Syncephalis fuscata]
MTETAIATTAVDATPTKADLVEPSVAVETPAIVTTADESIPVSPAVVIVEDITTGDSSTVATDTQKTVEVTGQDTLQVVKDANAEPRSSFDDLIGKFDTFRQKLRDGTLNIEDQDAFKELRDLSTNSADGDDTMGDEHDSIKGNGRKNKYDHGQQQRWSIRKSIRSFWRGDRSVSDEDISDAILVASPIVPTSVPTHDIETPSVEATSPTNDSVPSELAATTTTTIVRNSSSNDTQANTLTEDKVSMERTSTKETKEDKRRSKGWKAWMFWQAETTTPAATTPAETTPVSNTTLTTTTAAAF